MRAYASRVRATCLFVSPGDDRGALDELLRRRPDIRAVVAKGGDQLGIAGGEAAAEAGHRRPLRERVEHEDVRPIGQLERRRRRLGEPELAVRLVAREDEPVVARERRESFEQSKWRHGAGRVVRRVQPDECRSLPGLLRDAVQLREEPAPLEQGKLDHPRSGECCPARGNRVPGLRHDDGVAPAVEVEHDLREREDRLLRAERGDHVSIGIELHVVASPDPCRDRSSGARGARVRPDSPSARGRRRGAPAGSPGRWARAGRPSRSRSPRALVLCVRPPPR